MNDPLVEYHTRRTLKGLQDSFDVAKTTKAKVELAKTIDALTYTRLKAQEIANIRKDMDNHGL